MNIYATHNWSEISKRLRTVVYIVIIKASSLLDRILLYFWHIRREFLLFLTDSRWQFFSFYVCKMCVNQYTMVPAVVNLVATKGRDTYSGIISEFTCFKCKSFSVSGFESLLYAMKQFYITKSQRESSSKRCQYC